MLLTPKEAADILGLSAFTIRRLLRQGELPGRKVGKRQWRIRRIDLEEYLNLRDSPQPARSSSKIEKLAAEQGVLPVADFTQLLGETHAWSESDEGSEGDETESVEEFIAAIRELRESSPVRNRV